MHNLSENQIANIEKQLVDSFARKRAYNQFINEWQEDYKQNAQKVGLQDLIVKAQMVETLGLNKHIITMIACHDNFRLKYISKNVTEITGYSIEEMDNWGGNKLFSTLYWKQLLAPLKLHQWGKDFIKKVPNELIQINPKHFLCGIKIKTKSGGLRTFFFSSNRLLFDDKKQPLVTIVFAEDITPLFKGDFYWSRHVRGEHQEFKNCYLSKGEKRKFKDLISKREMQILQLILEQKESKEIANALNLSIKTVEQHRKNMIARSGAKDMTALIQLCRMAEII